MRLVELIHRTARRARTGDFTQLELAEKGDVLQSVNAAMQKVYNVLPLYFKTMTVGFALPAPVTVSLQVTNGSKQLGATVFSTAQLGSTVVITGDSGWNQVEGPDLLQNPYMGATGTVSAIVYGDSVFSDRYPFDRIMGSPQFTDQSQLPLIRRTIQNANVPYLGMTPSIGRPSMWWVQPFGNSQGRLPLLFLRLFPLPDQAYAINVPLAFWPTRLTLDDYQANAIIPVPDQFLDVCLVPLAIRALMDTPAFLTRGGSDEQSLKESAAEADNFLKLQPGQVAAPSNRIGTPIGY
jgi:hypothetical protein